MEILAVTYHHDVRRFLQDAKEQAGIQRVVRRALRRFKCADLKGARRAAVRSAVQKALTLRYRKRTSKQYGVVTYVRLKES